MNQKLIVAILVIAAVPVCAQAQKPSAVTKADAQKVIKIISGHKAKSHTYCDIVKLGDQIEQAGEKKDTKKADELSQKIDELGKQLGPEYVALMDGLRDIDPEFGRRSGDWFDVHDVRQIVCGVATGSHSAAILFFFEFFLGPGDHCSGFFLSGSNFCSRCKVEKT